MRDYIVIRPKTSFRRGLGAATPTPPATPTGGPARIHPTGGLPPARRGVPAPGFRVAFGGPLSGAPPWLQQAVGPEIQKASAATVAAFNAALANAVAYGVISTQGAAALQAQASGATDATVQGLTAQINQQMTSTPSAAAVAAGGAAASSAAAAVTDTSWWDGSTTLFGQTIPNPILVIGSGLAAVAIWAAFKKK